ncbi:MAG: penicillin-binding protein 2 [Candidatus Moranbacteria bacterium]|nr:penicillin-binding protein 2 [Candidatus Moranbacteria bacterium]
MFKRIFSKKNQKHQWGEIDISNVVSSPASQERKLEPPVGLKNLRIFFGLIVLIILVIISRTGYLQIVRGSYYADRAENNRISRIIVKAPRGIITDKNGEKLVKNIASSDAVIIPSLLPKKPEEKAQVLKHCFGVIKFQDREQTVNMPDLEELEQKSYKSYLVKEDINRDELLSIKVHENECPGFRTEDTAIREYPYAQAFSHILGYTGKVTAEDLEADSSYLMTDIVGRIGVESYWEEELRGVHGAYNVEVDSSGKILRKLDESLPRFGNQLVLSVDKNLQQKSYEMVENIINDPKRDIQNASVVILDPQNGQVRALVSYPGFDSNLFSKKIDSEIYQEMLEDPANPLFNRAIAGKYPPGSTVKPYLGAAILEEGVVNADTSFDCHGQIVVNEDWEFNDWKVHGPDIDIRKAIAESCDVYFYIAGGGFESFRGLGINRIVEYAGMFGFGQPTGIDLDGEGSGFIPTPEWKQDYKDEKWYVGNTYHVSIGQGDFSATPLQIAFVTASIANHGTLYQPHLVTEIINPETNQVVETIAPKTINSNFISDHHLDVVRQGMKQTIESGTARSLNDLGLELGGKTGTAQIGGSDKTHSWFTGFAPYEDPEIAFAILFEEAGEATDAAVPAAREILKTYFDIKEPKNQDQTDQDSDQADQASDQTDSAQPDSANQQDVESRDQNPEQSPDARTQTTEPSDRDQDPE